MKFLTGTLCNIGGREYNQDSLDCYSDGNLACLVVCDGLGSYFGSEIASSIASKAVVDEYIKRSKTGAEGLVALKSCLDNIRLAHNTIVEYKNNNPRFFSSCTTLAGVFTDCKHTIAAHIGDSRIYFFRNNKLRYQSVDHSMAQMAVERGEIKLRDIRTHKDQNKLTRVLGSDYFTPPDTMDIGELIIGDKFLLCTDGFWEYIYEEEMENLFSVCLTPGEALSKMENLLLKRVDAHNDNYTAVACYVTKED